jgi:hypothetical protein
MIEVYVTEIKDALGWMDGVMPPSYLQHPHLIPRTDERAKTELGKVYKDKEEGDHA